MIDYQEQVNRDVWQANCAIVVAMILFVLILLGIGVAIATAHEAPSGWKYPMNCCHEQHCRPVACNEIHRIHKEVGNGPYGPPTVYNWEYNGFIFQKVEPSGDSSCHACFANDYKPGRDGNKYGLCLFEPGAV